MKFTHVLWKLAKVISDFWITVRDFLEDWGSITMAHELKCGKRTDLGNYWACILIRVVGAKNVVSSPNWEDLSEDGPCSILHQVLDDKREKMHQIVRGGTVVLEKVIKIQMLSQSRWNSLRRTGKETPNTYVQMENKHAAEEHKDLGITASVWAGHMLRPGKTRAVEIRCY